MICGRSPVTVLGLPLEVDHVEPLSKGGADALSNYQTLCQRCNRGKGNHAELNKALAADIAICLDAINPAIQQQLASGHAVRVVANHEDFVTLVRANASHDPPALHPSADYECRDRYRGARRYRFGTIHDTSGVKAILISPWPSDPGDTAGAYGHSLLM